MLRSAFFQRHMEFLGFWLEVEASIAVPPYINCYKTGMATVVPFGIESRKFSQYQLVLILEFGRFALWRSEV